MRQVRIRQVRIRQVRTEQLYVAQGRARQVRARHGHRRLGRGREIQVRIRQVRIRQVRTIQACNHQARTHQARLHEARTVQARTPQVRTVQVRISQSPTRQHRKRQGRTRERRIRQVHTRQVRVGQVRTGQVRTRQVRRRHAGRDVVHALVGDQRAVIHGRVGVPQARSRQVRIRQVRARHKREGQVRIRQVRTRQVRSPQVGIRQGRARQVRIHQVRTRQGNGRQVRTRQVRTRQVYTDHPRVESGGTRKVRIRQDRTIEIDVPQVRIGQVRTRQVRTLQVGLFLVATRPVHPRGRRRRTDSRCRRRCRRGRRRGRLVQPDHLIRVTRRQVVNGRCVAQHGAGRPVLRIGLRVGVVHLLLALCVAGIPLLDVCRLGRRSQEYACCRQPARRSLARRRNLRLCARLHRRLVQPDHLIRVNRCQGVNGRCVARHGAVRPVLRVGLRIGIVHLRLALCVAGIPLLLQPGRDRAAGGQHGRVDGRVGAACRRPDLDPRRPPTRIDGHRRQTIPTPARHSGAHRARTFDATRSKQAAVLVLRGHSLARSDERLRPLVAGFKHLDAGRPELLQADDDGRKHATTSALMPGEPALG